MMYSQESTTLNDYLLQSDIVLLGEQTHGDGAVFDEKVKIIKTLHEEHNFNIIVFESGLYDNFKAHQLYSSGNEKINIYNQSIFPMWSNTRAFQDLLAYVDQNPEIKILGFDSQESSLFQNFYLEDLKNIISKHSLYVSKESFIQIEKFLIFRDIEQYMNDSMGFEKIVSSFDSIANQLQSITNKNLEERIIEQAFISALSDLRYSYDYRTGKKVAIQNPRDKQMAENFIFLKEQFPDEKFIGWGASYHFANQLSSFTYTSKTEDYIVTLHEQEREVTLHNEIELQEQIDEIKEIKSSLPMGKILKEYYKNRLYSVAFTSFGGNYLGVHEKNFKVLQSTQNSIEYNLNKLKKDNVLIDLKQYEDKEFYASVLGYLPLFAKWEMVFDGIYYIPSMYPPHFVEYKPHTFNDEKLNKAEQVVKGQIFDAETKMPLGYSDIYYRHNNMSVVANTDGKYLIDKSKKGNDYLFFSNIGYDTDSVKISDINSFCKTYLNRTQNMDTLDEVIIIGKAKRLSAFDIIKKARNKIDENYIQEAYNQVFMCKVQNYNTKGDLTFNEQALIKIYNRKGVNGSNNVETNLHAEIDHLVNTTNNFSKDKWSGIGSLWVTLNRDVIFSKSNVLYRTTSYDLIREGVMNYDGNEVYKISFKNNSPGSYSTGYGYPAPEKSNGFIYIDKITFAVLKYEHCITRIKNLPKRAKYTQQNSHKIVQSYKKVNGFYFINLLEINDRTNFYSKDDTLLGTTHKVTSITSQDIETENIVTIDRPLINVKRGYEYIKDDEYWLGRNVDSKLFNGKFNCETNH
ncbi:erythromycin esterase family protein [Winogradskyella eximia]|uniref:erythromycin esterase family protein n=1 Tax=Winogradskyella eximia TaxID=262006 RepID=UPI0024919566|nr:erythromycin esterase family protein [Winogradskyella eximia]